MAKDSQALTKLHNHSEGHNLSVICLCDHSFTIECSRTLQQLGFQTNITDLSTPGAGHDIPNDSLYILLIDDLSSEISENLAALREARNLQIIAIIDGKKSNWDSQLLDICDEFLVWPCQTNELKCRINRFQHHIQRKVSNILDPHLFEQFINLNMIGKAPNFLDTLNIIRKVSACDAPTCIFGETGTGKELAARAIHYIGSRQDQAFIPVNCGAIPDNLIESELFGHKKGAFTDAREDYPGVVEQADGGTLFLDEIDSLSMKAQISLLRFLQNQEYKPLGGTKLKTANVRIIAASNADLNDLVSQGRFRQDLLFRINIMSVNLPPLRERIEDIRVLAQYFLNKYNSQNKLADKKFHPTLIGWMEKKDWPGNVRELENFIYREYMLTDAEVIYGSMFNGQAEATEPQKNVLGIAFSFDGGLRSAKSRLVDEFEKEYLQWVMNETHGNVTMAAQRAGKERRALGKLLKKHGFRASDFIQ